MQHLKQTIVCVRVGIVHYQLDDLTGLAAFEASERTKATSECGVVG